MNPDVKERAHNPSIIENAETLRRATDSPHPTEPEEVINSAPRQGPWGPALALAAFGLAMVGQFYLLKLRSVKDAVLLYGGALLAFFVLVWRTGLADQIREPGLALWNRAHSVLETYPTRIVLVALAFLLDLTAVRMLRAKPMNATRWDVFALWVAAIALFSAATLRVEWRALVSRARRLGRDLLQEYRSLLQEHWIEISSVVALTALAFSLRFVALDHIPDVIDSDGADLGLIALQVLRGEMRDMFATFKSYGTMYLFLMAIPLKLFGANPFGLRFIEAFAGSVTIPLLFLLGRRLFDARIGFIAAAITAVSHYHLHFSHIVPGETLDPLLAVATFYLLYRGLEDRDINSLILSGITLGLAQYMFVGARLIGVIVIAYVALLFFLERRSILENLSGLALFALAALLVSAPMIRWALDRTDDYMARVNQTGIIQSGWLTYQVRTTGRPTILILLDQIRKAFLVFNYYPVKGFYNATIPVLDLVSGGVFILGLGYSLLYLFDRRHLLLNIWFWSGVVIGGALLLNTEISAYRIIVVFPTITLFVAIGFTKLVDLGTRGIEDQKQVAFLFHITFLILIAFFNLRYYFLEYIPQCRYTDQNTATAAKIGEYLRNLEPEYQGYYLGLPRTHMNWAYRNLSFLSGGRRVIDIEQPLESAIGAVDPSRPKVFFIHPQRAQDLNVVRKRYPGGSSTELRRCGRLLVTVYRVDQP